MNKKLILSSICAIGFVMGNAFAASTPSTQPKETAKTCAVGEHWCQIKSDVSSIGSTTADASSKAWDNSKGARDQIADNSKSAYDASKASVSQSWGNAKQNTKQVGQSISQWGDGVQKAVMGENPDKAAAAKKDINTTPSEK